MNRILVSRLLSAAALLIVGAFAQVESVNAEVIGPNPCPNSSSNSLPWMGDVVSEEITIPSLAGAGGATSYPGAITRPASGHPGKLPVVVLQHGWGGNRCNLWWVAMYLAGRGYITEIHSSNFDPNPFLAYISAVDATRSALARLATINREPGPLQGRLDLGKLGLGGHSLGSVVASSLQGDESLGIDTILTTDTLRRYLFGDPGGAVNECLPPPLEDSEVTPRVPALSFAKDEPCNVRPDFAPSDLKLTGPRWWTDHGIPNMQLVMKGYNHFDFADFTTAEKKRDMAVWIGPWFDLWLKADRSAYDRLTTRTVNGTRASELLSTGFQSSACLPGRLDTEQLRKRMEREDSRPVRSRCDAYDPPSPEITSIRLSPPGRKIRAGRIIRLKLTIRNSGYGAARGIKVRLKSPSGELRLQKRSLKVNVPAKASLSRKVQVKVSPGAKGKAILKARVAGQTARTAVRVVRSPRKKSPR